MADHDGEASPAPEFRGADISYAENATDMERGLRFAHVVLSAHRQVSDEAIATLQALAQVMIDKGLVDRDEFEAERVRARESVAEVVQPGVRLEHRGDKYSEPRAVEIDCAARIHLCHGRCCQYNFCLTAQDLDEGVAKWDYGNPYWIRHGADGYCVHSDPATRGCTIHAQRPHVCRTYDCRGDARIWVDFEARIPAPVRQHRPFIPVGGAEFAFDGSYARRGPLLGEPGYRAPGERDEG